MATIKFNEDAEMQQIKKDAIKFRTIRNINRIIAEVKIQKKYTNLYSVDLILGMLNDQRDRYDKIVKISEEIINLHNKLIDELYNAKEYIECSRK